MDKPAQGVFSQPENDELDLRRYWHVVNRYKWGILGLAFAVTLAAVFAVSSITPVYESTATLLIDQKERKVISSLDDMSGSDISSKEYLQTQFEILKSRELARRVVVDLDIAHHPDFMEQPVKEKAWWQFVDWHAFLPTGHAQALPPTEEEKQNALVDRFMLNLSIEPVRQTQLVKISFESHDPKLAAQVPNALAKVYITSQMEARVALTEQAAGWLSDRLGILKANLEASAKTLQDYRVQNNLIETGNQGGILTLAGSQVEQITQRVLDAQLKYNQVSKHYGVKHPALIEAQLELESAQKALDEAKADALEVGKKEFHLQELQREVETNRNLYDTFFTRIKEANESLQLETANARLVDQAIVPSLPIKPRKSLIVSLTLIVSLMGAVGLAFLLDFLDNTFKGIEDVETKLRTSMLGMVPMVQSKKGESSQVYFLDSKQHAYAEAMRTVRTRVVLSGIDKPHRIMLLTSSVPSEGKTTSSINLAVALAQMERVLLIDADMRRPSVGKTLGIPSTNPGLANVVAGTIELDDCIMHMDDANIDVLSAGLIPPNPLELLSSQRFADLLEQLTKRYDRIIIDSPPSLLVSDAIVLSKLVDAVLYVVHADTTPHHTAREGVLRLRTANAPLIGVLLNKVNMRKAAKYYGAYAGYYNYNYYTYGYSHKADKL